MQSRRSTPRHQALQPNDYYAAQQPNANLFEPIDRAFELLSDME